MAGQLSLTKNQISDVLAICGLPLDSIKGVLDTVVQAKVAPLHPDHVRRALPETEKRADEIQSLLRLSLGLISLQRHTDLTAEIILDMIGASFSRGSEAESAFDPKKWKARRPLLATILANDRFQTISKALELSYDYMNILQTSRIITDVRPLYDADGDHVEGLIIAFTLRVIYDSAEGQHSLSLALDSADIKRLEEQCCRALVKARAARDKIAEPAGLPSLVSGSQDSDAI